MIVEVTQDDIDKGCRANAYRCPVALALSRTFNKHVGANSCWAAFESHDVRLPEIASKFVKDFDCELPVSPIRFEIDA